MDQKNFEEEILKVLTGAEQVYVAVLNRLDLPKDDEIYKSMVFGMLKRQTRDHLIFSVWNHLSDEQAVHLKDYVNQYAVIAPDKSTDEIILEFALMYDDLMEKVFKDLSDFFRKFIERFNEIRRA